MSAQACGAAEVGERHESEEKKPKKIPKGKNSVSSFQTSFREKYANVLNLLQETYS